ncbi:MAG: siderophore-interacting protein [Burkholderiaceae bacterium]
MNQDTSSPISARSLPERVRHPLRFRELQVLQREAISPGMLRVTLGGPALEGFYSPGFDDHVKLIFPDQVTGAILCPEVGPNGPIWPEGERPVMRDYTPRHYDAKAGTLAIDFALHEAGPATSWALGAQPGDSLGVGGPRGSLLVPTDYDWHLLVGDETALPAIARRLQALPADARAVVLVEVDGPDHVLALSAGAHVSIYWVYRSGAEPGSTTALFDTLKGVTFPDGDFYAWVACETTAARAIRAQLIERGAHPRHIKAAGYWRRGVAATHDTIEA